MPQVNLSQEAKDRLDKFRKTDRGEVSSSQAVLSLLDHYYSNQKETEE
jgi:hypothetical protein